MTFCLMTKGAGAGTLITTQDDAKGGIDFAEIEQLIGQALG